MRSPTRRLWRGALWLALSLLGAAPAAGWAGPCSAPPEAGRPSVGLVLGGGGARGAAHIGVLQVLEEMGVQVDCIAGTSMGAIVGGLYAAGLSPADIERELAAIDWDALLEDAPPRPERPFRRKRDDDTYLVKQALGWKEGALKLPLGLVHGQKFDVALSRVTQGTAGLESFDALRVPFRAVATDIETGQPVVLERGNLARAIQASMALPGVFDSVEIEGRMLIDGYVSNNVPVDVARAMGAERVIVVEVGNPLRKREDITSMVSVVVQLAALLSRRNVEAQLATLEPADILIQPDLEGFTLLDFRRTADVVERGAQAARAHHQPLLALGTGRPAAPRVIAGAAAPPPVIDFIRLENQSGIDDAVLRRPFAGLVGRPLDQAALERALTEVYGWELFESVRYELVEQDGRQGLLLQVKENRWGPNYLEFGVSLASDFRGDATWNVGASLLKTALNRRAGEWRLAAQVGQEPIFFTELYQPLDLGLRWFVNPQLLYDVRSVRQFRGDSVAAEQRVERYGASLAFGRVLGSWGEARLGLRRYRGEVETLIGDPVQTVADFESAEAFFKLTYDTLDDRNWPRRGALAEWTWLEALPELGASDRFSQSLLGAGAVHTWGRNTFFGKLEFGYTAAGRAPAQNRFRTGGFGQLSGFTENQLSGEQLLVLGVGGYRRINDFQWMPAYLGASLEYGNVFEDRADISLAPDDTLLAGSVFLGLDTLLGPLFLGYGHAEGGRSSVYFYLGRIF